jgi:hypothetical protein
VVPGCRVRNPGDFLREELIDAAREDLRADPNDSDVSYFIVSEDASCLSAFLRIGQARKHSQSKDVAPF